MPIVHDSLAVLQEASGATLPGWVSAAPAGSVVGVVCASAPAELLHAAGLTPLRLHVPGPAEPAGDAWLPPFACSVVRGILGAALAGRFDGLAGIVIPHTCDTVQELAGIWRLLRPEQWLLTPVEPVAVESPHAPTYLRQELLAQGTLLARRTGCPLSDDALAASIALYNRLRRAMRALDGLRDRLSAAEAWGALGAAWKMPPETYVRMAEALVEALREAEPRSTASPPLLLAGSLLDEPLVPQLIDQLGGRVVADDLCSGMRGADVDAAEAGDPWLALASRMLRRAPCPARHAPEQGYAERLVRLARQRGARGVVQVLVRYCDPLGFEVAAAESALAGAGQTCLRLEIEATNPPAPLRTRLQAFLELLVAQT